MVISALEHAESFSHLELKDDLSTLRAVLTPLIQDCGDALPVNPSTETQNNTITK
jgi:hypothetical protein